MPVNAKTVERRLRALRDPEMAAHHLRFFKCGPGQYGEGDRFLGIRVPELRKLEREFASLSLDDAITLLQSPWHEARLLALMILVRQYPRADDATRDEIHRLYLANTHRINNWDLVDVSAHHVVGAHVRAARAKATSKRDLLGTLARSQSLWERRIAIVATLQFIRHNELDETLRIAELLLADRHDLIHKATGWMLREVGKRDQRVLETFLRKHAGTMPRTMLRYAIERFPETLRQRYLRVKLSFPLSS